MGRVTHQTKSEGDKEQISIALNKLSAGVRKIAITLTIYEEEKQQQVFSGVSGIYIRFNNSTNGEALFRFEFGSELKLETAIVVGELYVHKGEWKFNAIASGFHGGLSALCSNYGIKVIEQNESKEENKEVAAPPTKPVPAEPIHLRILRFFILTVLLKMIAGLSNSKGHEHLLSDVLAKIALFSVLV